MKLRLTLTLAACAAVACLSLPGSANSVKVDYNHHADFTAYHTYSWNKVNVSNQLNADRIKRAVGDELQKRGWKEVPSGGQITLMASDRFHSEKEAETYYDNMGGGMGMGMGMGMGWGGGWGWDGWGMGPGGGFGDETTTTTELRLSHLVLDMFDTKSKALMWRGVSRGELSDKSGKNREQLYKDVHVMFRDFPPKNK